uniref:Uncharacterized protein n=1 Tax=Ditylenchus dipsaci TaxID=166011 RepID=A0A915DV12_9BILA
MMQDAPSYKFLFATRQVSKGCLFQPDSISEKQFEKATSKVDFLAISSDGWKAQIIAMVTKYATRLGSA